MRFISYVKGISHIRKFFSTFGLTYFRTRTLELYTHKNVKKHKNFRTWCDTEKKYRKNCVFFCVHPITCKSKWVRQKVQKNILCVIPLFFVCISPKPFVSYFKAVFYRMLGSILSILNIWVAKYFHLTINFYKFCN